MPSPDVSPSARNYESLHAMAKSGYLLALAQRSSLDFIFKALLGTIENCTSDFQEPQSFSKMHEEKCLLFKGSLMTKSPSYSTINVNCFQNSRNYTLGKTTIFFIESKLNSSAHVLPADGLSLPLVAQQSRIFSLCAVFPS